MRKNTNVKPGEANINFVGFPDSHAVSQGFWKIQVGRPVVVI